MKRIVLTITACISVCYINAQTPTEASTFIPKITRPSPEAFSFTKYGDIPVGLFTGTMNYSIPLMQIQSGKISVPVSLDYASNGIKVDGVSGRTGMDWNLKIGGVITRNILGRLDEHNALYTPSSNDSSSTTFYNYMKYVGENSINTQPDEYSYSFMGASGKFYFDYAGNLRELTPSGFKISRLNSAFQIIDQSGTQYYFSAIEDTYNYSYYGDQNAINNSDGGATAWYLTKIKNNYGDSIVYNYTMLGPSSIQYVSGISQTYKEIHYLGASAEVDGSYLVSSNCGPMGEMRWATFGFGDYNAVGTNTDIRLTTMTAVQLTEVLFKGGKLQLYYSSREDLPNERKLDSIDLFSTHNNTRIKTIGLSYEYSQASSAYNTPASASPNNTSLQTTYPYLSKRLFLDKVKFYNASKTDSIYFKLDYDNINSLPPRLSFAQDYFGYFNGKVNNNFLPSNLNFNGRIYVPGLSSSRDVDTVYHKRGLLNKITYPTGGFTTIQYESNRFKMSEAIEDLDTVSATINYGTQSFVSYSNSFSIRNPYKLRVQAEWITPPDYNGPLNDSNVLFSLIDAQTGSCVLFCTSSLNAGDYYEYFIQDYQLANTGTYKLKLEGGNPDVRAWIEFIDFDYEYDTIQNKATAGVRVATIKSYTSFGDLASYKKFNYDGPDGYSSGTSVIDFSDKRDFCYIERKMGTYMGSEAYVANYVISSSGYVGGYSNDYAAINYQYVTEIFDSLGNSGSTTTQFLIGKSSLPTTFNCSKPDYVYQHSPFLIQGAPNTNTGFLNGKEFKKTIHRKDGSLLKKVQESINYYVVDTRLYHIDSFYVIRKVINRSMAYTGTNYFYDYDINKYKRITAWVRLDSSIQKEYDVLDNELKTKTVYNYGNESHMLPTLVWQIDSKGDTSKKLTKYTDDLRQLNPGNSVLTNMVGANIVNVPLKNQSYSNNVLLTTSEIEYNSSFLPYTLKTSRYNDALDLEAEYTAYDVLGNPREYKQRGVPNALLVDTTSGDMIAGCQNALFNDIAYCSFETVYSGNWSGINTSSIQSSGGLTGDKYYNGGFNIYKNGLTSTNKYLVSYWSKSGAYSITGTQSSWPRTIHSIVYAGSTWTLYEHLVTGQTTIAISGNGAIDELRLHPQSSMMTTYTYKPLVGLHTVCDPTNRISYYEYDGFDRLRLIRDSNKNILKKYDYKYALQ